MSRLDRVSRTAFPYGKANQPLPQHQWYHLTLTTYGSWLYGDRRGFRTRRHREHVDGDYKRPPPAGKYARQEARSKALLKQDPVWLDAAYRCVVGEALVIRLRQLGAFVLTTAVSARHLHCQLKTRFADRNELVAAAKRHVWFEMRSAGWEKKLWAKGKRLAPIRTESHHRYTFDYIVRHTDQGAWVWVWEGVSDARIERIFD